MPTTELTSTTLPTEANHLQATEVISPATRLVLLGASNMTEAASTLIGLAGRLWPGPLEVLTAVGHGRSFGKWSSLLGRNIPSIAHCGLWPALEQLPAAPTYAVISDVGNDIFYNQPVDAIAEWVQQCITRLRKVGAEVALTSLPMCNLPRLQPWRFLVVRSIVFPKCRLSLDEVQARAEQLNFILREMATREGTHFVEQQADWYGIDPLHLSPRHWTRAYGEILGKLAQEPIPTLSRFSMAKRLNLWRLVRFARAADFTILGIPAGRPQPSWGSGNILIGHAF